MSAAVEHGKPRHFSFFTLRLPNSEEQKTGPAILPPQWSWRGWPGGSLPDESGAKPGGENRQ